MILVTGASGNIGRELVERLRAAGAPVRAGYHGRKGAPAAGVEPVELDLSRPATLDQALRGAERMFLLTGNAPDQLAMERNAVAAARAAGIRHVVKLSVWSAPEEPFSFARLHRTIEKEIEASGIGYTFLRPNGFMQNMSNFMAATIRSQGAFYLPAGDARISHVDVRDVAAVAARVLTQPGHEGKAYDLSGPEALTYGDIAARLSAVLGKAVAYVDVPDEAFKQGGLQAGMPEWLVDAMIELFHFYKTGRASRVTSAVRDVTGEDPISFDRYVRDHAPAFA